MTKVIRRLANVPQEKALEEFQAAYPEAQTIYPFPKEERDGVEVYVARVVTAEFPFGKDDDSGSDDGGDKEPKSDSSDSDSSSDSSDKPKSKGESKGGGNKEVLDLLHQIAGALGIPTAQDDPGAMGDDMVPPPDNLDLPDVGAPPQGGALPPPAHPGGGMGGGHSFAANLPAKFMAFVEDADDLTPAQAAKLANANFPGYVAHHAGIRQAKYNGRNQVIAIAEMHKQS